MSTPVLYVNPSDGIAARDLEKHSMVIEYVCTLCGPHEYTCTLCEPQWLCLAGFGTVCCQRPGDAHHGHWVHLYFVLQGLGLYAARDLEKHTMVIEYACTLSCRVWDCMLPETWRNTPWSLSTLVTWSATRLPTVGRRNMMTRYASTLVNHPLLLCSGCLSVGCWL